MKNQGIPTKKLTYKVTSQSDLEQVVKYIEALRKNDNSYKPHIRSEEEKEKMSALGGSASGGK